MARVYNFSAGPSMLPEAVLTKAAAEMLDYEGSGQSVMEMSHRSKVYQSIIDTTEALLREIMNIPENYKVLFLQGGASSQFAMVPMNLMTGSGKADYIITGQWAKKAYKEAARYGNARAVASSEDKTFSYIPKVAKEDLDPEADYVHICMNNTIYGTVYHDLPDTGDVPLVADISSCVLSKPIDVSKFGILYAGAQKNMAPSGVTVVIIREDLIGKAMDITPTMFNYQTHADNGSMFNTPPTLPIYTALCNLRWVREQGGVVEMARRAEERATVVYDEIERNSLFMATAVEEDRSYMNIDFVMAPGYEELEASFASFAAECGVVAIKGHRSVGGFRASCYNAMPLEGAKVLAACMREFEKNVKK